MKDCIGKPEKIHTAVSECALFLLNPLATNATIVALVLKNEITYYEITHS